MEQRQSGQIPLIYRIIPATVLAFITGLVYYPSLSYDFQFDDIANITKHFDIRHYSFSKLFFSGTRWISYWFNSLHYQYGKFDPFSYRVGNVIIHTSNGLLLFFTLLLILTRLPQKNFFKRNALSLSFLTALLFLIHPVQTQTVSYVIQGQLEGLAALFTLSMTLLFLVRSYTQNQMLKWGATGLFFALAVLITGTKEIAIVSPFLIMLVDWFFVARGSWNSFKTRLWLHAANSIIVIGLYIFLMKIDFFIELFSLKMEMGNNLGNIITGGPKEKIKPLTFFISQFKVILHYLWMFIWPFNISVEYDWMLCKSIFSPDCFLPFSLLATIAYTIYKLLQRDKTNVIAFAAIWFAIVMAPRSTIMPSPELLVDYKTYLASFAWLFILSAGIIKLYEWIQKKRPSFEQFSQKYKVQYALLSCCALLLSYGTITRNKIWSSGVDFWGNIVTNAPGKARAHNNYGVELSQKLGRFSDSIQFFTHAIEMDEEYRDPYNNLAVAYAATHQIDRAIETLQKSLRINPYYPEAYNNMASFMIEKKDHEMAIRALRNAIQLRPHYGKAHFNMGRALMELGEPEKAWESFKRACLEADLDNESGFFGYARASLMLKKYDDAIFACKKVLEFNPENHEIAFTLANVYYESGKYDQAAQAYTGLLQKSPNDGRLWHNLAESQFSAGNTAQALKAFERVKLIPGAHPNTYMRIASCYEKLGNPRMAQSSLKELLRQPIPEEAKQSVQTALSKINQQYRLS
ncbi:tetratricopeptide repeat protein [Candidatus Dependentiae bacterium]